MMVRQVFTKIGNFIENRHTFMLLIVIAQSLLILKIFTHAWGRFFVDTVYIHFQGLLPQGDHHVGPHSSSVLQYI